MMEIKIWHVILFLIYVLWSIKAVHAIKTKKDLLFKEDKNHVYYDDHGFDHYQYYTPFTNIWIVMHFVVLLMIIVVLIGQIPYQTIIYTIK